MARTRAHGWAAVVIAVAAMAVACGDEGSGLVVEGKAPPAPYSGPLYVPPVKVEMKGDEEPGPKELLLRSGAAGKAVECEGDLYSGGGSDRWSKGDGGSTPEEGLEMHWDHNGEDLPDYDFRIEAREKGRVLFSFDVAGKTKQAVVVAKDRPKRPGWGPETAATCDPSEFPESYTDTLDYDLWTDANGDRAPVQEVRSSAGAEHCDWQDAHVLTLGENSEGGGQRYLGDPEGVLPEEMFASPYVKDAQLPDDAKDTGYRLDDWRLWVTEDDDSKVYIRTSDGVEIWPAMEPGMGCA